MRLALIEQPNTLLLRIAYWMTKRAYGRVITPMKVVYARIPKVLPMTRAMVKFAHSGLRLDQSLVSLICTHVAQCDGELLQFDQPAFGNRVGRVVLPRGNETEEIVRPNGAMA